jgi:sugar lactone lactonase YvrE
MVERLEAELVLDARAELGEGPVWDDRTGRLVWVDILGRALHALDPRTGADEVLDVGALVGAAVPRAAGGWMLAVQDGFARLPDWEGGPELVAPVEADVPDNRFNDGKCDRAGRFWAGTMALDERDGAGALYRLDGDGRVTRVIAGVGISNGLAWSADDTRMYYVDSLTGRVDVLDYDAATGEVADRRPAVTLEPGAPLPDGMSIDAEGRLWVALFGGGAVRCYAPDGTLEAEVAVDASQVTSCAFGDEDLGTLYITSAARAVRDAEPHAGGVFRVRPGVRGLNPEAYREA